MTNADAAFAPLQHDQRCLLDAFVLYGVDFLVVGGYAMRCHGWTRKTNDLDLVVSQAEANLTAIDFAVASLPRTGTELPSGTLRHPEAKFRYLNVEVFASMRGLDYGTMKAGAILATWSSREIPVLDRTWLKKSKRLAIEAPDRGPKRETDAEDLAYLEALGEA